MRKQLTGEPVAGEPHTGFGGRRRRAPFPTPIHRPTAGVDDSPLLGSLIQLNLSVANAYPELVEGHSAGAKESTNLRPVVDRNDNFIPLWISVHGSVGRRKIFRKFT